MYETPKTRRDKLPFPQLVNAGFLNHQQYYEPPSIYMFTQPQMAPFPSPHRLPKAPQHPQPLEPPPLAQRVRPAPRGAGKARPTKEGFVWKTRRKFPRLDLYLFACLNMYIYIYHIYTSYYKYYIHMIYIYIIYIHMIYIYIYILYTYDIYILYTCINGINV